VGDKGALALASPARVVADLEGRRSAEYPADWRPRFADAYRLQNKAWIRSIESAAPSPIAATAWDGYCATAVAEAGVRALAGGRKVQVDRTDKPSLYA